MRLGPFDPNSIRVRRGEGGGGLPIGGAGGLAASAGFAAAFGTGLATHSARPDGSGLTITSR